MQQIIVPRLARDIRGDIFGVHVNGIGYVHLRDVEFIGRFSLTMYEDISLFHTVAHSLSESVTEFYRMMKMKTNLTITSRKSHRKKRLTLRPHLGHFPDNRDRLLCVCTRRASFACTNV